MSRSVSVLCAAVVVLASAHAQVRVAKTGERAWTIESRALRVTLDAQRGSVDVVDKRCGSKWEGRPAPAGRSIGWTMPAAATDIVIDGRIGPDEWPAPEIALTAANQTEGKKKPRPEDFSARVHAAWAQGRLLVAVSVRDNRACFPKSDEPKWWEWDSVEFWVGSQQCAVIPQPPGGTVLAMGKGAVPGAQVASRVGHGGWQCEFSVPFPVGAAKRRQPFRFALGVNDADEPAGGRKFQLYFPSSWQHSAPETFARTSLAQTGQPPRALGGATRELRDITRLPDGIRATAPALSASGGKLWDATLTVRVEQNDQLVIEIDRRPRDAQTGMFTALAPLASSQPAEIYGARYCNGIAVRDDDKRFRGRHWQAYGSLDMPWVGYGAADGPAYVLLFEDPNDARAVLEPRGNDGRLVPVPYHDSQKGRFAYPRRIRYIFVDAGGFVAMCKRYRSYAKEQGILKTLREKMRTRPQLDRIAGAPDFWGITPAVCRQMRALGVRHAIVNGRWPAPEMEQVKALGYLVSRYDNYEDMLEGPREQFLRGKIPDDVVKHANGSLMKAWLTWDKKTQFMKRCSVLYEEVARLQIPADLAKHPYNARFIDVTTACWLRECYDPVHPCTRTEDMKARQRLANYVSNELKLVLGGEHGRWWGVPYYDYWEGMQSGGFYSWPAGHVGINLPQKREDISEVYWEFGIGEKRRVPLWELTFGDCTVSTWYWGDSTGHLYKAAPDVADRKDCFNLLYGTVPLFWTNRPFSFNWSDEKLRLRLLQSYFVTCPVHEQVAFDELVDYRYLTPDRSVHQSAFAGGVTITVNFADRPFQATAAGREYELPRFGFLVTGKGVLAYRATVGGRTVTYVQTPVTIYCDAGGAEYDFGTVRTAGRVAVQREKGRARVMMLEGGPPRLNLSGWLDGWAPGAALLYAEDKKLAPQRSVEGRWEGAWLQVPSGHKTLAIVAGKQAARPDLTIQRARVRKSPVMQGQALEVTVRLSNVARRAVRGVTVGVYLDERAKENELSRTRADVRPGGRALVRLSVDTSTIDGRHTLVVAADPDNSVAEISEANNEAAVEAVVLANPAGWPLRFELEVNPGAVTREGVCVEHEIDLARLGAPAELAGKDLSVRVLRTQDGKISHQPPAQFEPAGPKGTAGALRGTLRFIDTIRAGEVARYLVLVGPRPARVRSTPVISWDPDSQTVRTPCYQVRFEQGHLAAWRSFLSGAPEGPFLDRLAASDAAFGWSSERGKKWDVSCLAVGPAMTAIRVHKVLEGGFEYTKLYRFYPRYFVIEAEFNKPPSVWTRAAYAMPCHFADSAGHRTEIDGKGQGEGVIGQAPGVRWYAAWTDTWAHSAINLSPPNANLTYWDAGLLGEVGFSAGAAAGLRAAYVLHPGADGPDFAERDYAALTQPLHIKVYSGSRGAE